MLLLLMQMDVQIQQALQLLSQWNLQLLMLDWIQQLIVMMVMDKLELILLEIQMEMD